MSTPAPATGPHTAPAPPTAFRRFTTSRAGAIVHVVFGGAVGTGLTLGLILALLASLLGGMPLLLILIPVAPILVFWALDAYFFTPKGSLGRGAIAAVITVVGVIILFAFARDGGNDDLKLFIGGLIVGILAVAATRTKDLFSSRRPRTGDVPPAVIG